MVTVLQHEFTHFMGQQADGPIEKLLHAKEYPLSCICLISSNRSSTSSAANYSTRDANYLCKRGIKLDTITYTVLKDSNQWESWYCLTLAQSRAQDVSEITAGLTTQFKTQSFVMIRLKERANPPHFPTGNKSTNTVYKPWRWVDPWFWCHWVLNLSLNRYWFDQIIQTWGKSPNKWTKTLPF